ncbi:hypothetical protein HCN44_000020 [Aphidius gifuensis]|uniref:Gustatory receptor n=1 Tax=Aphidius gifuensis TaxID=684658 RepID=A0A835CRH3_APHGI|nr:peroxisomal membrane protein 11C [Aphidius gifuensis]XP_044012682.1 peroxisomal membrane protein 11C [Aphidius gifuensis]KAF7990215.1 hypothetical protein HCN44_000020 [Aphidius gifuensis]
MELITDYLETYEGRDKFLRTLSYTSKLLTIIPRSQENVNKIKYFSSQMSDCRVMLRLFDDIPTIYYAYSYWNGKQESDSLLRWLNIVQNILDIVYSPIETVCWLGEHKLLKINIDKWDNVSTWFWIISLYISLVKAMRKRHHYCKLKCNKQSLNKAEVERVDEKINNETLTCVRMLLDITYAISYLPDGILWAGKFKTWHVGALGSLSSIISLYQVFKKQASDK